MLYFTPFRLAVSFVDIPDGIDAQIISTDKKYDKVRVVTFAAIIILGTLPMAHAFFSNQPALHHSAVGYALALTFLAFGALV